MYSEFLYPAESVCESDRPQIDVHVSADNIVLMFHDPGDSRDIFNVEGLMLIVLSYIYRSQSNHGYNG